MPSVCESTRTLLKLPHSPARRLVHPARAPARLPRQHDDCLPAHDANVLCLTALDGEIKTVNRCFSESEDDKYGNMRATSVNVMPYFLVFVFESNPLHFSQRLSFSLVNRTRCKLYITYEWHAPGLTLNVCAHTI